MNLMLNGVPHHRRLWLAATIILVFIVAGFVLSVPRTRDIPQESVLSTATSSAPAVALRDTFKKGVHTLSGSLLAPNACTSVTAEAFLQGEASTTENILVALTMPEDTGICLQLPTKMDFKATLSAPADLPISVTVNGAPATISAP